MGTSWLVLVPLRSDSEAGSVLLECKLDSAAATGMNVIVKVLGGNGIAGVMLTEKESKQVKQILFPS